MPTIICAKCGGTTNTAVCDWFSPVRDDGKANECYARRNKENTKWERGCGKPDGITKKIVDDMLNEEEKEQPREQDKELLQRIEDVKNNKYWVVVCSSVKEIIEYYTKRIGVLEKEYDDMTGTRNNIITQQQEEIKRMDTKIKEREKKKPGSEIAGNVKAVYDLICRSFSPDQVDELLSKFIPGKSSKDKS